MVQTKSEARRVITQGGVKVNGEVYDQLDELEIGEEGLVLQKGKRHFVKIMKS